MNEKRNIQLSVLPENTNVPGQARARIWTARSIAERTNHGTPFFIVSSKNLVIQSFKEFILEVMWCSHGFCLSHNSCMTWVPRPGEGSSEKIGRW